MILKTLYSSFLERKDLLVDRYNAGFTLVLDNSFEKYQIEELILETHGGLARDRLQNSKSFFRQIFLNQKFNLTVVDREFTSTWMAQELRDRFPDWGDRVHLYTDKLRQGIKTYLPVLLGDLTEDITQSEEIREDLRSEIAFLSDIWSHFSKLRATDEDWIAAHLLASEFIKPLLNTHVVFVSNPHLTTSERRLWEKLASHGFEVECLEMAKTSSSRAQVSPQWLRAATPLSEVALACDRVQKALSSDRRVAIFVPREEPIYVEQMRRYLSDVVSLQTDVLLCENLQVQIWLEHLRSMIQGSEASALEAEQAASGFAESDYETLRSRWIEPEHLGPKDFQVLRPKANAVLPRQLAPEEFVSFVMEWAVSLEISLLSLGNEVISNWTSRFLAQFPKVALKKRFDTDLLFRNFSALAGKIRLTAAERDFGANPLLLFFDEICHVEEIDEAIALGCEQAQSQYRASSWGAKEIVACTGLDLDLGECVESCPSWLSHLVNLDAASILATVPEMKLDGTPARPDLLFLKQEAQQGALHVEVDSLGPSDPTGVPEALTSRKTVARFSLSQLETYLKCPFRWGATYQLGLQDKDTLDMDLGSRSKGSLHHDLLERVIKESVPPEDLESFVRSFFREAPGKFGPMDAVEMEFLIAKSVLFLRSFLNAEEQFYANNPKPIRVEAEVKVDAVFCRESLKFKPKVDGHRRDREFDFTFRFDRLEWFDEKTVILVDYKSSTSGHTNWSKWLANQEIQLVGYAKAFSDLNPGVSLVGALYYDLKELKRTKGFLLNSPSTPPLAGLSKSLSLEPAEKEQLFAEFSVMVSETLSRILGGDISPAPSDLKICDLCRWRRVCRAPHLN